ncbi:MAG: hypothetical protein Q8L90_14475 [Bacteroidota bacterium]|nr:hypothetical protein [Bacteroidota bacterium]
MTAEFFANIKVSKLNYHFMSTNKINGVIKVITTISSIYLLFLMFAYKGYTLGLDFSTEDSIAKVLATYIGFFIALNYIVYLFLSGIRQYKSQHSKYRIMYYFAIPLMVYSIIRYLGMFLTIFSEGYLFTLNNILVFSFYTLTTYTITIETYYQFGRKKEINNNIEKLS